MRLGLGTLAWPICHLRRLPCFTSSLLIVPHCIILVQHVLPPPRLQDIVLLGGVEHLFFFHTLGIIIPTDELIFFRGVGKVYRQAVSGWLAVAGGRGVLQWQYLDPDLRHSGDQLRWHLAPRSEGWLMKPLCHLWVGKTWHTQWQTTILEMIYPTYSGLKQLKHGIVFPWRCWHSPHAAMPLTTCLCLQQASCASCRQPYAGAQHLR